MNEEYQSKNVELMNIEFNENRFVIYMSREMCACAYDCSRKNFANLFLPSPLGDPKFGVFVNKLHSGELH